jgi:putative acetyltransferase
MTVEIRKAEAGDVARLHEIWREAVLATHAFLSPEAFAELDQLVGSGYLPNAALMIALDGRGRPVGYMGTTGANIDALFVDPAAHGNGYGRALVEWLRAQHPVLTVDVNEQNPSGVGFYRHMGFVETGRSPVDQAGRPYPLLHMRLG